MKKAINLIFFITFFSVNNFSQSLKLGLKTSYSIPYNQLGKATKNGLSYELSFSSDFFYDVRKRLYANVAMYNTSNVPFLSSKDYFNSFQTVDYYIDKAINLTIGTGLDYSLLNLKNTKFYLGPDVFLGRSFVNYHESPEVYSYKESIFLIGFKLRLGIEYSIKNLKLFTEFSQSSYFSTSYFYKEMFELDHRSFTNSSEFGIGIRF